MNPNFMNNISPELMQNRFNMMNPEMMKNASNMIAGMSDSQIQMYLAQMGMGGIDPSMFRNMCQNMSNMSDSQFNNMKNVAQAHYQNMNNNNNNYNNVNNTNANENNKSNNNYNNTIVQEVTKMKEEGNTLFRDNKYNEAIKKYYDTIEEIKTSIDKDKYKTELDNIERLCRLNIAACKLKTEDYDGVINECSIVLEKNKCFKGYYRMGLALLYKKKYDKAYRYLDNANAMGTTSEKKSVEPYLKDCKEKLDEIKKKEREERIKKQKEKEKEEKEKEKEKEKEEKNKEDENLKNQSNKNNNNNINEKESNKLKTLKDILEKEKENNKDYKKNKEKKENEEKKEDIKEEEDDIKVEDSKEIKDNKNNNSTSTSSSGANNYNTFNNNNINNSFNKPPNLDQDFINQARNQINNMSDDQLNMMIEQMKNMDNQTMKNMMAAQGMNLTDQQIEMMKMSLTPETFKMMRNQNFNPPNINNTNNNINSTNNNINNNNSVNNMPPQMPNFANMDFQQMFDFIKKNPELLKMVSPQLSKMMGGKNIDPEIMMKSVEKIMWIFSIPGKIKRFMLSWRGICFIIFIIAIFYGLFKRK